MHLEFRRGSAWASKKARKVAASLEPKDIKKVAVIRHAAIGDMMVIRPFLVALRNFFPNAEITFSVTRSYFYGTPEDLVDHVHIIDKDKGEGGKTSFFTRWKQAKELGPHDIIFDFTDSNLSLITLIANRARLKIGYPYRLFKRLFFDITTLRSDFSLEIESILHQLYILGAPLQWPYDFALPKNEQKLKTIVYFAGASVPDKCWPYDNFFSLIKKMAIKYPEFTHIILEGIKGNEKFDEIYLPLQHMDNVIKKQAMPLNEVFHYLSQVGLVISNDTGIRNMAIAANAPTLGIFFNTVPYRYWPRSKEHDIVFNENYEVPTVDHVFEKVHTILNNNQYD
jgi:ADP-heptose:LPS heptosyltransferase